MNRLTFTTCDCCRLPTMRLGHVVHECGGRERELHFCRDCAGCWQPKPDGSVAIAASCRQRTPLAPTA